MKRTGSAGRNSRSSACSSHDGGRSKGKAQDRAFAMCVRNDGCPASLELRKVYRVLPDAEAEAHGMVRVVDESQEDYLFPAEYFVPVSVPARAAAVFPAD